MIFKAKAGGAIRKKRYSFKFFSGDVFLLETFSSIKRREYSTTFSHKINTPKKGLKME